MKDLSFEKRISSLEDINKEIEATRQRIKTKETGLKESLKVLPNELLSYVISPITSTISSIVGGNFLLHVFGLIKKSFTGAKNNNEENKSDKNTFISSSIKNVGLVYLLKLINKITGHI